MIEGRFVGCKHFFKQQSGEQITADSWLMRDLFDTKVERNQGKISEPKKLQTLGVKRSDTKRMIYNVVVLVFSRGTQLEFNNQRWSKGF
jgi:hypothetical protein